ncbi:hypothetical protein DFJ74DRAFT_669385 [Hyaloraphidium curvatum]|nr:hypothetical protein DFJ74DRAFT_669385 [Hyaloraphidium curvatum]
MFPIQSFSPILHPKQSDSIHLTSSNPTASVPRVLPDTHRRSLGAEARRRRHAHLVHPLPLLVPPPALHLDLHLHRLVARGFLPRGRGAGQRLPDLRRHRVPQEVVPVAGLLVAVVRVVVRDEGRGGRGRLARGGGGGGGHGRLGGRGGEVVREEGAVRGGAEGGGRDGGGVGPLGGVADWREVLAGKSVGRVTGVTGARPHLDVHLVVLLDLAAVRFLVLALALGRAQRRGGEPDHAAGAGEVDVHFPLARLTRRRPSPSPPLCSAGSRQCSARRVLRGVSRSRGPPGGGPPTVERTGTPGTRTPAVQRASAGRTRARGFCKRRRR